MLVVDSKNQVKAFDSVLAGGEDAGARFDRFKHVVVDVVCGFDANRSVNAFHVEHKLPRFPAK